MLPPSFTLAFQSKREESERLSPILPPYSTRALLRTLSLSLSPRIARLHLSPEPHATRRSQSLECSSALGTVDDAILKRAKRGGSDERGAPLNPHPRIPTSFFPLCPPPCACRHRTRALYRNRGTDEATSAVLKSNTADGVQWRKKAPCVCFARRRCRRRPFDDPRPPLFPSLSPALLLLPSPTQRPLPPPPPLSHQHRHETLEKHGRNQNHRNQRL